MADILVEERADIGMATIMARRGVGPERIGAALGLAAPTRPARAESGSGLALIGTGAGTWLAQAEGTDPFWAEDLRARLAGLASVSDQSGAYVVLHLTGEGARTVLQRGVSIDLHPAAFGAGAATTVIAHIGVVLWTAGENAYDLALYRSYLESFRHWLDTGIAAL